MGNEVEERGRDQRARHRLLPGHRLVRAAEDQPERRAIDVIDVIAGVLLLLGPDALAWRDRWPLISVAFASPGRA